MAAWGLWAVSRHVRVRCNFRWRAAMDAWRQAMAAYDPLDAGHQSRPEPPVSRHHGPVNPSGAASARPGSGSASPSSTPSPASSPPPPTGTGRPPPTAAPPVRPGSPSPSRAADDLDDMYSMLTGWESAYRDWHGWDSGPPKGDLASGKPKPSTACPATSPGSSPHPWPPTSAGKSSMAPRDRRHRQSRRPHPAQAAPLPRLRAAHPRLDRRGGPGGLRQLRPRLVMSYAQYEAEVERVTA